MKDKSKILDDVLPTQRINRYDKITFKNYCKGKGSNMSKEIRKFIFEKIGKKIN